MQAGLDVPGLSACCAGRPEPGACCPSGCARQHGHTFGAAHRDVCGRGPRAWPHPCGISAQVPGRACAGVYPEGVRSYLPLCRGSGYPVLASTLSPHPPGLGPGRGGDQSWCPRSSQQREAEQRAALARLAGRLESMNDVEELTALVSPGPGAREGTGPVKTWTHSPTPEAHPSPTAAGRRGVRGAQADPSRHPPRAGPGDRGYAPALSPPQPRCTLPSATPPPPPPRPPASHLTLLPSLPAATLAGRLYSGRPNSGSREDSQARAAHRLEPCEVRGVGEVLGPAMPAPQSACVSFTVSGGCPACVWGILGL